MTHDPKHVLAALLARGKITQEEYEAGCKSEAEFERLLQRYAASVSARGR